MLVEVPSGTPLLTEMLVEVVAASIQTSRLRLAGETYESKISRAKTGWFACTRRIRAVEFNCEFPETFNVSITLVLLAPSLHVIKDTERA